MMMMMMNSARLLAALLMLSVTIIDAKPKLTFKPDGTFKILHISDTHYEMNPDTPCQAIEEGLPCNKHNTTEFIAALLQEEKPDIVVHTGDIIDWDTNPDWAGMDDVYGVSIQADVLWAATLGNHDDDGDLSRRQVMDYIVNMKNALSVNNEENIMGEEEGDLKSYGNFYLEIFNTSTSKSPSFRTYHLDSSTNNASINPEQVSWFTNISSELKSQAAVPALAFFHIALEEYGIAAKNSNISGTWNEPVSNQPINNGLFSALKEAGDVKATFCGHDHTNDFCADHEGIQLCYQGSAGYQAYTFKGWPRRCRVTELRDWGATVTSWKRLGDVGNSIVDKEVLWSANHPADFSHRKKSRTPGRNFRQYFKSIMRYLMSNVFFTY